MRTIQICRLQRHPFWSRGVLQLDSPKIRLGPLDDLNLSELIRRMDTEVACPYPACPSPEVLHSVSQHQRSPMTDDSNLASDPPALAGLAWKGPFRGKDLAASPAQLPSVPAVYLWRRGLSLGTDVATSSDGLLQSMRKLLQVPLISVGAFNFRPSERHPAQLRSNLLHFAGLAVGGGGLSPGKEDEWRDLLDHAPNRRALFAFLDRTLATFGPVVYVGETEDLRGRLSDHLERQSPLQKRLRHLGIALEDCHLWHVTLGDLDRAKRQAFEQLVTELLIAPLTHRAG